MNRFLSLLLCATWLLGGKTPAFGSSLQNQGNPLDAIDAVVAEAISKKNTPGAVVLVGHKGSILFERNYGNRSLEPRLEAMTLNTVFDVASLSKVVSTATAVMSLLETGRLHLEDRLVKYLPAFGQGGKEQITLRQLLTHYSGFPPDLPRPDLKYTQHAKPSRKTITRKIFQIKLEALPDEKFIYSDIGFFALGKVVEKVTGKSLAKYAQERIFAPLAMKNTGYTPPSQWRSRIAPTEKHPWGEILRGKVHDPTAYLLGGVAGHAGLFSSAQDLSRFCQMILNGGELDGKRILRPETVQQMTSPQSPAGKKELRGFGWDIQTAYSTPRGSAFSPQSFGHTGYTGTSIWIDPPTQTYLIILTNRVHPQDKGSVKELRMKIADLVGAFVTGENPEKKDPVPAETLRP